MGEADYIVVGAGSAGSVLAARLTEYSSSSVRLFEAGGSDKHALIQMPLAWMSAITKPQFGWGYMSEPDPNLDNRVQPLPRGRLLGGCSSINGSMYIRGAAADYNGWADAGVSGWSYADVLPYFRRAETNWRGESADHGGDGPLHVTPMTPHAELFPAFIETAKVLGHEAAPDFNVPQPEGFGIPDCTITKGRRQSTYRAYLKPNLDRPNLEIVTGAHVLKILFEGRRAVGVQYRQGGETRTLRARREVILCGGAFNSPQMLMLSGIGPAADLKVLGIAPLVDLPGVGRNLQDHPIGLCFFQAAKPNTFEKELRLDRLAFNVLRWAVTGKGTPAQSPLTIQAFLRSSAAQDRPDIQLQVSHVSYAAYPWFPLIKPGVGHQISSGVILLNPASRGHVRLASSDPMALAKVQLNLLSEESDRVTMREMFRFLRTFFSTAPARDYVSQEVAPGPAATSDEAIDDWLRATVMSAAHPACTCAMGTSPQAVVDEKLCVRQVEGLRVVDVSVMPTIIRGNTNAPAIMIAEKAADLILGRQTPRA